MEQDQKHTGTCTFIDKWTTLKLLSGMKKTLNEKVILKKKKKKVFQS